MKLKAILIVMAMCICMSFAAAETVNTIPQVGDVIAGFKVTAVREYDPLDAQIVYLTHEKTGGPVMWIANDDTNRSFQIGFRTHYDEETGVPHVFEHAALSGSETYPDSGLFFNMISNTTETYLNASTYAFMTVYPCATISEKQLLKFADVYLAGVFEPLVVKDAHAMQREAYRYELKDAESELTLTGTVYSEMKGNYYAYEETYEEMRAMYPNSWWATCTGGQPGYIENMTQQDLIDFHDTYYQPSNALTILYGDLNPEDFLSVIATYYDRYDQVEVSMDDPNYAPITGTTVQTVEISASADAAAETTLCYDIPVSGFSNMDISLLSSIINTAINNNSSALHHLMMERYPSASFSISLDEDGPVAMLRFTLKQAPNEDASAFAATVQEGIKAVLEEGINYELLNAKVKETRISNSRIREQSNLGVDTSKRIMIYYALTGDIDFYLNKLAMQVDGIDEWVSGGIIEKILNEAVVDPADSLQLTLNKIPGRMEEIEAASAQKLADKQAGMSNEEIAAAIAATEDFNAWTASVSEVSMIDEVNVVSVDELPEEVQTADATVSSKNGVRYITSEIAKCDTITENFYFRADMIPTDQLQAFSYAINMLGSSSTSKHSYEELQTLMTEYGVSFTIDLKHNGDTDQFTPIVKMSIDCLAEDYDAALALAVEVLTDTTFEDVDLLRYISASTVKQKKDTIVQSKPHYLARMIAKACGNDAELYNYNISWLPYYQYMESVSLMDDAAFTAEAEEWKSILASLVNRNELICSVISSSEGIAYAKEKTEAAAANWPLSYRTSIDYASTMEKMPKRVAVTIPGSAAYHIQLASAEEAGYEFKPEMKIMSGLVYDQLLIPIMRFQNGVYSPIDDLDEDDVFVLAYRDPSATKTFDEVIPSISSLLGEIELTEKTTDNLIIGNYTEYAMPKGPRSLANTAISDIINNKNTPAKKLEMMAGYKAVTAERILENSWIYDKLSENGAIVSVLPASMYNQNPDRYDTVISWLVE